MQEGDEGKGEEKLPRRESWQTVDEESLTPIDEETGEGEAIDSIQEAPAGYVMEEIDPPGEQEGENSNDMDETISIGTNADGVMDQIDEFSSDPEILEDFSERQGLNTGSDQLLEKLNEHHSMKPGLSAGDIDAAWEATNVSGEESAGGSVATPDQDVVEEIGEALGLEYADDEPLQTEDKLDQRDQDRWELDPASVVDQLDEADIDEEDFNSLSTQLDEEFAEVEGEVTGFRSRNQGPEEDWEDFSEDDDEQVDFDEFEDELDEDFFESLDEMEDKE